MGQKISITNIISEPSGSTAQFVIFGTVVGAGDKRGETLVLHLDFKSVFPRDCVKKEDNALSDFESWTPASQKADSCVFGIKNV
jgi:hypothetical protein